VSIFFEQRVYARSPSRGKSHHSNNHECYVAWTEIEKLEESVRIKPPRIAPARRNAETPFGQVVYGVVPPGRAQKYIAFFEIDGEPGTVSEKRNIRVVTVGARNADKTALIPVPSGEIRVEQKRVLGMD
jgi:hypothetical protein